MLPYQQYSVLSVSYPVDRTWTNWLVFFMKAAKGGELFLFPVCVYLVGFICLLFTRDSNNTLFNGLWNFNEKTHILAYRKHPAKISSCMDQE